MNRTQERILIIDDEEDILKVLSSRLAHAGYEVITCTSPYEGLVKARDLSPDLIILDVMMPGMNGLEVKTHFSEDNLLRETPVIFLTAKGDVTDKVRGLGLGADDYVTKPFELDELLARIRAALNRRIHYENISVTDGLTGLNNAHAFQKEFRSLFLTAQRYGRPFSIVVFDVDHFKKINDRLGHKAGDTVLKAVAQVMREVFRDADFLVRYGGDEFIALLPESTEAQALVVTERFQKKLSEQPVTAGHSGERTTVHVSAGIASHKPLMRDENEMFFEADRKMYLQKAERKQTARARKKILLVEDEPDMASPLLFRLRQAGFETLWVQEGPAAVREAEVQKPDAIILDLMLPGLPGEEVCRAIRGNSEDEVSGIPVIMLTAKSTDVDHVIGKVLGADVYMTKPYDMGILLQTVHDLILKREQKPGL